MNNIKRATLRRLEALEAKRKAAEEPLIIRLDYGDGDFEEIRIVMPTPWKKAR